MGFVFLLEMSVVLVLSACFFVVAVFAAASSYVQGGGFLLGKLNSSILDGERLGWRR